MGALYTVLYDMAETGFKYVNNGPLQIFINV